MLRSSLEPSSLLDLLRREATSYRTHGFSLIPTTGKAGRFPWRQFQRELPGENLIADWFSGRHDGISGVAVIAGPVSGGLTIRDYDKADAYHEWAAAHPKLAAKLPTVATPRGYHLYFRSTVQRIIKLSDGELRGKGFCLAPPSLHPSGVVYSWTIPLPDGPLPRVDPRRSGLLTPQQSKDTQETHQHIACVPRSSISYPEYLLPNGPGQRNGKIFQLARYLKRTMPDAKPAMLKSVVEEWFQYALPHIRTKDFGTSWADFQTAWMNVKQPHFGNLHAAYAAARQAPEPAIDGIDELGVLVALCRNLADASGTFFLSCRSVEELFHISRMTAWRWFQTLRFYGVIEAVQIGTLKESKATVWKFFHQEQAVK